MSMLNNRFWRCDNLLTPNPRRAAWLLAAELVTTVAVVAILPAFGVAQTWQNTLWTFVCVGLAVSIIEVPWRRRYPPEEWASWPRVTAAGFWTGMGVALAGSLFGAYVGFPSAYNFLMPVAGSVVMFSMAWPRPPTVD